LAGSSQLADFGNHTFGRMMQFEEPSCSGKAEKIFLFLPVHGQVGQVTQSICSQFDRMMAFENCPGDVRRQVRDTSTTEWCDAGRPV